MSINGLGFLGKHNLHREAAVATLYQCWFCSEIFNVRVCAIAKYRSACKRTDGFLVVNFYTHGSMDVTFV